MPPVRDEEHEIQRKAHAKRVRETRRSTQGDDDDDDVDDDDGRVILILTKFGILISTWFQVVPFGV